MINIPAASGSDMTGWIGVSRTCSDAGCVSEDVVSSARLRWLTSRKAVRLDSIMTSLIVAVR
jgi:hypothetical protein